MFGGGQYSHALTMNWIEATFLAELLRDSEAVTKPRALKQGISNYYDKHWITDHATRWDYSNTAVRRTRMDYGFISNR